MKIPAELNFLVFYILPVITVNGLCPGRGGCQVRQLGSPQYTTLLLQCQDSNCTSAVFAPSPNMVCLIRYSTSTNGDSTVRIYLGSCSKLSKNEGYFLSRTANIVPSNQGVGAQSTAFQDTSCETICEAIEVVTYTSNGQTLVADNVRVSTSTTADCDRGLYVYPDVIPAGACNKIGPIASTPSGQPASTTAAGPAGPAGPVGPVGPPVRGTLPRKQCPSHTRRRALLTVTDGISTFAVGSPERLRDGSYRLPIAEECYGEVFYTQQYLSQAVGIRGAVELVTTYTLQLVRSRKYLVADVLDDTRLNITGAYSTGLTLKDASKFPQGYARTPDYRFFVRYNVTVYNLTASVFCPLFHRNYCLFPAVSGYLRLNLVNGNYGSVEPTFVNPTEKILRRYVLHLRPSNLTGPWHVALRFL